MVQRLIIDPLQIPRVGEEITVDDTGEATERLGLKVLAPYLRSPPLDVDAPVIVHVENMVDLFPPLEGERFALIATRGFDTLCWLVKLGHGVSPPQRAPRGLHGGAGRIFCPAGRLEGQAIGL
jgi:hypothetical protein